MDNIDPKYLPGSYYSFQNYNDPIRMITYWHQINEVLSEQPASVLEIGIGSGLVSSYLEALGIKVTKFDLNESLSPDIVGDVRDLERLIDKKYDVVLCARVLHHLPFQDLESVITSLLEVTKKRLVITLPVNDMRIYFFSRYTSSGLFSKSLPLPLFLKKFISIILRKNYGSGLWMLNDGKSMKYFSFVEFLKKSFSLVNHYRIKEDMSHAVFVFDATSK